MIQFARLEPADRIVVRTRFDEVIQTIDDKAQIDAAVRFIRQYETGWRDPMSGPLVPQFMLDFVVGGRRIGSYGIGVGYVVSDPTTDGFWSRDVPEGDVKRLAGETYHGGQVSPRSPGWWNRITGIVGAVATAGGALFGYVELSAGKDPMAVLLQALRVTVEIIATLVLLTLVVLWLRNRR